MNRLIGLIDGVFLRCKRQLLDCKECAVGQGRTERLGERLHGAMLLFVGLAGRARQWEAEAWGWMRRDTGAGADTVRRRTRMLLSAVRDWRTGKLRLDWRGLVTKPAVIAAVTGTVLVCGSLQLIQNDPNARLIPGRFRAGGTQLLSASERPGNAADLDNPTPQQNMAVNRVINSKQYLKLSAGKQQGPHLVAYAGRISRGSATVVSWPARGPITSPFGWRSIFGRRDFHTGIDIAAGYGTPVRAAAPGAVVLAGWAGPYGRCVLINHGGGLVTRYAHLSRIDVSLGERVSTGEIVGNVGESGNATGPHLHFEVIVNGSVQNPLHYLH